MWIKIHNIAEWVHRDNVEVLRRNNHDRNWSSSLGGGWLWYPSCFRLIPHYSYWYKLKQCLRKTI
ncbi:hypothetical protein AAJ76_1700052293 [Vairimorpha ceranae]|uniref:Uncharacterized protein n=1 Tax=Vairimorpha ceranae TaxID=40302 RepID=A0A0F9WRS1_9MICR|nr:hypothetical protein AAJ76_1700052293 [Vairimorpha ceranae]KKO75593.1 hypothetical protein AAJ76_1700052293 [Vairimorpha ceranae]